MIGPGLKEKADDDIEMHTTGFPHNLGWPPQVQKSQHRYITVEIYRFYAFEFQDLNLTVE
jgi:hypothetical protein